MKGGALLEEVGRIQVIALNKTGTLTEGRPRVTDVVPLAPSERQIMSLATALETGSSHSLALAILDHAKAAGAPVPPAADASARGGRGITGRVGGEARVPGLTGRVGRAGPARGGSAPARADPPIRRQDGVGVARGRRGRGSDRDARRALG